MTAVALMALLIVGCFVMIASLRRRIEEAERRHDARVDALNARINALEMTLRTPVPPAAAPPPPQPVLTPRPVPAPQRVVPTPAAAPPAVMAPPPAVAPTPVAAASDSSGPLSRASAQPVSPAFEARDGGEWEVTVGSSWLNKLGVLVFVIGVALLVGYSMAHVGPAGRVAIGYTLSLAMLTIGVVVQRRPQYANYAYGLIAGGWAGTYFTTYAMHGLASARIVDNDVVATCALVAVAAGMVRHSLRYRSPLVTSLAYLVAYATVALTPLSGFAMIAALPLAVSVLFVAQRFSWSRVAVLGVVSTYGVFAVRGVVFPGGLMDRAALAPYLALAAYWITFEVADIATLRRRLAAIPSGDAAPIFALNAVGFVGAAVLQLPFENSRLVFWFLTLSGIAYLASAIVRAAVLRAAAGPARDQGAPAAGTPQHAVALAVALVAWAIDVRFAGARETAALVLETELLLAAGLTLGDRSIRLLASAVAALATVHAVSLIGRDAALPDWLPAWRSWSPVLAATAACWYANRESLRARRVSPEWLEAAYTPAASLLVVTVLFWEAAPHFGIALYSFAVALLAAGIYVDPQYRYQAYAAGAFGGLVLVRDYVALPELFTNAQAAWTLLAAGTASYGSALTLLTQSDRRMNRTDQPYAAAIIWWLGTAWLAILEWRVLDVTFVAPAWALTGAVQLWIGLRRPAIPLRVLGYVLLLIAVSHAVPLVLLSAPGAGEYRFSAGAVIAMLYLATIIGRSAIARTGTMPDLEDAIRVVVSLAATVAASTLVLHDVRPTLITLALGLQGAILLAAGFPLRERVLRLSGLALLLFCILKLFVHDLAQLEALARILSFVVLGLVLLAVSWTYTRFREQIRKLL